MRAPAEEILRLSPVSFLVLEAAPSLARRLGVEPSQMVGRSISQWISPSERDDVLLALRSLARAPMVGSGDRAFALPLISREGRRFGWTVRVELTRAPTQSAEITQIILLPHANPLAA